MFEWYGRYWLEIFRLPAEVRHGAVVPNFTIDGYEHITDGLAAGKGVILALPHLGGWEWAAAWMAAQGHHMLAVVEPLEPPELLEWFAAPARSDRARDRAARSRRVAAWCCARCATTASCACSATATSTGDGVEVEFFGERTTLPARSGHARTAHRVRRSCRSRCTSTRAAGTTAWCARRSPTEREGRLRDDIARITQALADEFEALIRAAPEQWHLLQPNWPSDRE